MGMNHVQQHTAALFTLAPKSYTEIVYTINLPSVQNMETKPF